MGYLVEFDTDDPVDGGIIVDVSEVDAGPIPVGVDPAQIARRASLTFEQAFVQIRHIADASISSFGLMKERPDEIRVDFAIKLTADVGAVLAKVGGEANLAVSLTWHPPRRTA
jgi:Trypsin-co-occurring domain 1